MPRDELPLLHGEEQEQRRLMGSAHIKTASSTMHLLCSIANSHSTTFRTNNIMFFDLFFYSRMRTVWYPLRPLGQKYCKYVYSHSQKPKAPDVRMLQKHALPVTKTAVPFKSTRFKFRRYTPQRQPCGSTTPTTVVLYPPNKHITHLATRAQKEFASSANI